MAHTHAATREEGRAGQRQGVHVIMLEAVAVAGKWERGLFPTTETHICVSLVNRDKSLLRVIWTTCFASGVGRTKINIATYPSIYTYTPYRTYVCGCACVCLCAQRNKNKVFRTQSGYTQSGFDFMSV